MKLSVPSEHMKHLLEDAVSVVGKRGDQYGTPIDDFQRIAIMWDALKPGAHYRPHEVAMHMICLKLSRMTHSPENYDHWLDIAGYAACGWACIKQEEERANEQKDTLGFFVGDESHVHTINSGVK